MKVDSSTPNFTFVDEQVRYGTPEIVKKMYEFYEYKGYIPCAVLTKFSRSMGY